MTTDFTDYMDFTELNLAHAVSIFLFEAKPASRRLVAEPGLGYSVREHIRRATSVSSTARFAVAPGIR